MAISKKMINANALAEQIDLFHCPICSSSMVLKDYAQLVCEKNHSFDLSKQGYVNLAPQAHVTKYDRTLFEARKRIMTSGYFQPVLNRLIELIETHANKKPILRMLDAGSGEGSHLAYLASNMEREIAGVGIDLAKEGVLAAAKDYPGNSWVVADLANCPFQEKAFDVLLNILSPANYKEFTRILKEDGLFIKIVPENAYLKQLRAIFYEDVEKEKEGNPVDSVSAHFKNVTTERMTYDFPLDVDLLENLIRMTPLTWGASAEKIKQAKMSEIPFVTIDFTVIIATN